MLVHTKGTVWRHPDGDCFVVLSDPFACAKYKQYKYVIILGTSQVRELLIGVQDDPVELGEMKLT